jgi:hypothetical protein
MKKVEAEIWFWYPNERDVSHWWTGLVSNYIHVAPVINKWNLTAHIDGSEWLHVDDPTVADEYRNADTKVKVTIPSSSLIMPQRYEGYVLPRLPMWWYHICRNYLIEREEPIGNCVWLTKRVLGWNRPDIQTPDEIYKELVCR